jgi:hypothetical protein
MIHQTMGRAVLTQVRPTQYNFKEDLVEKLSGVLILFGPKRTKFNAMVAKIIEEAVELSNQMAEEQALFKHQMPKTGVFPNEIPNIRIADESQTGRVVMCTFPGFGRRVIDERKESMVWLVKSNAELQSGVSIEKQQ